MCSGDFKFPPFHISNFCNQRPNEIPNWFNFHRRFNPQDVFLQPPDLFLGHFGSSSGPAGSINLPLSYFYQHIHQNLPNSSLLSAQTNNQFSFNNTNQPVQFFNQPVQLDPSSLQQNPELMICHRAGAVGRKMRIVMRQSLVFLGKEPLYPGTVVTNIIQSFAISDQPSTEQRIAKIREQLDFFALMS